MIRTELDHRIDLRPPLHRCYLHCSTLALHTFPKQRHNCTFSLNMRLIVLQLQKEGTTLPKPAAQQKACYGSSCSSSCSLCILSQVLLKTSAVGESEWLYPDSFSGELISKLALEFNGCNGARHCPGSDPGNDNKLASNIPGIAKKGTGGCSQFTLVQTISKKCCMMSPSILVYSVNNAWFVCVCVCACVCWFVFGALIYFRQCSEASTWPTAP